MNKLPLYVFLFIATLTVSPATLFAVGSAGFENASFSAASLGEGNAVVAQADEPAAISYNPAGIVNLPGVQVQGNYHFISAITSVDSPRDEHLRSSGTISPVPTGYITINPGTILEDRIAFGIGSDSPFGLSNKWDSNYPNVHYTGWANYLKMFTIKPVMSVRVNDKLSMGVGPIYYRIFDFGGIEAYPNIIAAGTTGLTTDGQVRANLSGNTWGWQYGLLAKPWKKHQFGFYFRSPVTVQTKGRIKVENSFTGNFQTGASAKIDLPLNFTWGYAFLPNEKTTIEVDFGFTRWEAHKRLYINHTPVNAIEDPILNALGFQDKDYGNSYSFHLGGKRWLTDKFILRGGGWFLSQVVPQDHYIPAVPDGNRIGLVIGAGYDLTKNITIDFAYFNSINLRRKIANSLTEAIGQSVDGNYISHIQEVSFSLTYKWDDLFRRSNKSKIKNSNISK
jgi:long-chain fatty acid transport protein